jgi:serralysin
MTSTVFTPTTTLIAADDNNIDSLAREGEEIPVSIAAVLSVSNAGLTGNRYIDGILWGGNHWNSGSSTTIIDYSFWNSGTESFDDTYSDIATNSSDWLLGETVSMVNALNTWAAVANIQFVYAGDNNESATLCFYRVDNAQLYVLGSFYPPGTYADGIGYFNWEGVGWKTSGMTPGDYGFVTLIHELGHGLGLSHPHTNEGGSSIYPGVTSANDTGDYGLNQGVYTTMSYNDGLVHSGGDPGTEDYGYQGTPMAFDIAAIQHLYGANYNYQTGNNTYFLPTANEGATSYSCIWDAGGVDTISGMGARLGVTINLNDASLNAAINGAGAGGYISSANGIFGGFTIANSVVIENATGSDSDDQIIGNEFNNILDGGAGNDTINGGAGNDTINGGAGADILEGGAGIDTLSYIDSTAGVTVNLATGAVAGGHATGDTIVNFENVTGSSFNDTITGSIANNTLNGGAGNDTINGGAGADILEGGAGIDTLSYIDSTAGVTVNLATRCGGWWSCNR